MDEGAAGQDWTEKFWDVCLMLNISAGHVDTMAYS